MLLDASKSKVVKENAPKGSSTQLHLRIAEIRNDTVILKNGGTRAVLETNSVNFNLKSEEEQNSIIYSYQSFLNTLDFPVQILVKSRKLDLDDYLNELTGLAKKQENPLLQKQTYDYIEYVKRLLEYADIMDKAFYVIVPFNGVMKDDKPSGVLSFFKKFLDRMKGKQTDADFVRQKKEFENLKKGLDSRVNTVVAGLENCGLKVNRLKTQELVELFYYCYNPDLARLQKIKEIEKTDIEL